MKIFVFLFGSRNREASTTIESVLVSTSRCSSSLLGIIEMGKQVVVVEVEVEEEAEVEVEVLLPSPFSSARVSSPLK